MKERHEKWNGRGIRIRHKGIEILLKERGARVVLITDQWISPIARLAVHSLPLRIEAPSSWDSNIVPLFVAEALVSATINASWPETQERIRELEGLADMGRRAR